MWEITWILVNSLLDHRRLQSLAVAGNWLGTDSFVWWIGYSGTQHSWNRRYWYLHSNELWEAPTNILNKFLNPFYSHNQLNTYNKKCVSKVIQNNCHSAHRQHISTQFLVYLFNHNFFKNQSSYVEIVHNWYSPETSISPVHRPLISSSAVIPLLYTQVFLISDNCRKSRD